MQTEDLDFEIKLYKALIEEKPEYIEALIVLGNAYTEKGLYEKGLEIDLKLVHMKPDDEVVYYNLACSYSLLNMKEPALAALQKAVSLGYHDIAYMYEDTDLDNIRKEDVFESIVSCMKEL